MTKMKPKSARQRRTPWDLPPRKPVSCVSATESEVCPGAPLSGCIRLRGVYFFDPLVSSSEDIRRFLWAGLRVLKAETKARGLSDTQVRKLMGDAFEVFHDAANGLWGTLQQMMSSDDLCILTEPHRSSEQVQGVMKLEDTAKAQEPKTDYPDADFYEPVDFGWTPSGYEVRTALKRYSEPTHADR